MCFATSNSSKAGEILTNKFSMEELIIINKAFSSYRENTGLSETEFNKLLLNDYGDVKLRKINNLYMVIFFPKDIHVKDGGIQIELNSKTLEVEYIGEPRRLHASHTTATDE